MERRYIVFVFLAFSLQTAVCSGFSNFDYCNGTSWIRFNGNCYNFEYSYNKRVSYYDAEDFCRAQSAHLASIHSDEEQEFLLKTMESGRFGGRLWIGYNILDGDDKPQWSDGTPVDYQKRIPKEYYVNEKCFIMFLSKRGWRPEHCSLHYAPICKRPEGSIPTTIPPPTTLQPISGGCPKDWIQFGQKCYKYFGQEEKDRLKYKEATQACWALGKGHDLVSIHSMEEQAFLTQHLNELGTSAWIGMRQVTSDEIGHDLVFGWIDNSRTVFTNWDKGHPPPGTWKYCARLSYEGVSKGEWLADYCEIDKKGYICQRRSDPNLPTPTPEPSDCRNGFQKFRNSCYRFVSVPQNQKAAEEKCQHLGAHLVSVTDSFEQAFLYNFIGHKSQSVWTGLRNVQGLQYLRWEDKQPLYYSNWADKRPVVSSDSCFSMDSSNDFKWNVTDCSAALPYICKISKDAPPQIPEVIGKCPENEPSWIDIGDEFCYHVPSTPNALSWDSTSRYCLTKGMKMIKVNSDHQTNSLVAYLWKHDRPVHLSLIRSFDKSSFLWTDGSPLNYINWEEREPSSWSSDKDCVAFSQTTGKWKPIHCAEAGVPICQLSKTTTRVK
ncbi:macrophage mannose receptor 1-like [Uloborus diversus]|uniref:macrophage mannose receptor 1-like n=1 Tax=Uloborus diversus TaxID=327109 RepID=UPI0024092C7F|nr:macrophage mannose receptor 1-like [Uloborus diversus]